jgi:LysR family transcriptional regulator, regulator for metE and metH
MCVGLHVAMCKADAARAFVIDFIATVKRDSFARLPGILPLAYGG